MSRLKIASLFGASIAASLGLLLLLAHRFGGLDTLTAEEWAVIGIVAIALSLPMFLFEWRRGLKNPQSQNGFEPYMRVTALQLALAAVAAVEMIFGVTS